MRFMKTALAVAGLLVGSVAFAQPPGGGFGGGFGGGGLANSIARSKPLQEELKIDADQLEKLTAALTKAREESRELTQKLFNRDTPQEERTEIGKKIQEINNKAVESALKPDQVKRLHQIENQQAGLGLFNRDEVAKTLKLTDEQKEKIKSINKDLDSDRREIFGSAFGGGGGRPGGGGGGRQGGGRGFGRIDPEVTKKLESLQKEALASAVKVLNDEQQTAYKEMTGEHFEMPAGAFGFGGGGGFGGPGGGGGFGGPGGGGFGGFGGGGVPGQVLSSGVQDQLKLTADQKKELEAIQAEVDAKLDKMLTDQQRKQLKDLKDRRPGGGPPRKQDN